jgi:hypothetical protein
MSAVICGALRCDADPDELRKLARAHADRKTVRFLAAGTLSAFITAVELAAGCDDVAREGLGLFTVGGLEPDFTNEVPLPPGAAGEALVAVLAQYCQETVNPGEWLSHMPNTVVCHAAMTSGLQGPHAHFVGGRDAAWGALCQAIGALDAAIARAVAVVAFDPPDHGHRSYATGLLLRNGTDPAAEGAPVLDLPALEALPEGPASIALDAILEAAGVEVAPAGRRASESARG